MGEAGFPEMNLIINDSRQQQIPLKVDHFMTFCRNIRSDLGNTVSPHEQVGLLLLPFIN